MKNNKITKEDLCLSCLNNPIYNKKRHLCKKCYYKFYYKNHIKYQVKTKEQRQVLFIKKLYKKYGQKIINDFKSLKTKPFWNLIDIGNKYNFSTEYARQIYNKLFQEPYNIARIKKTKTINEEISCINDPRRKVAEYRSGKVRIGAVAELLFFKKCIELGFKTQILCNKSVDIKINDYLIEIKSASVAIKTTKTNNHSYYIFILSEEQRRIANFVACYIYPQKQFYIIPSKSLKGNTIYILSDYYTKRNRYLEYRNAWRLLIVKEK